MAGPTTPKELGYRLPAEWEPQEAVWFAWPVRDDLWSGRIDEVRKQLASLYVLAARFQTVRVLCPQRWQGRLTDLMAEQGDHSCVELFDYETDDVWIRDFGPLFLVDEDRKEICIADWRYNAWGDKFPKQKKDDQANGWIADQLKLRRFTFNQVLEGGAIESNGAGFILTTEAVLLNPNRNGAMTKSMAERMLISGLCADAVLWLKEGLVGDDTDGHIDNLARFFKPDGIIIADTPDSANPNYALLQTGISRLRSFVTHDGRPFGSVQLPLPDPIIVDNEPLAASYLNYLVLNGAVIVPTYRQPHRDAAAIDLLSDCFPDREIVGFDCTDIIREGGALHCMSQNQPVAG